MSKYLDAELHWTTEESLMELARAVADFDYSQLMVPPRSKSIVSK
jgi:hypothetical protein